MIKFNAKITAGIAVCGLLFGDNTIVASESIDLRTATQKGDVNTVRRLLNSGANPNHTDQFGKTPLHHAMRRNHEAIARLLITHGTDVKAKDARGQRPFDMCRNNPLYGRLRAAADARLESIRQWTTQLEHELPADAVHVVRGEILGFALHDWEIQNALQSHHNLIDIAVGDNKWTPLHSAASSGDEEKARLLITAGANVNASDCRGWVSLHHAAANGHEDVARLLINAGAEVRVHTTNHEHWTPLHYAVQAGHTGVVQLLIDFGARINTEDRKGATLLHYAAKKNYEAVARLLLNAGAKIQATTRLKKWTPLHVAAYNGHASIVQLLIDYGAHLEAKDRHHKTPLCLAIKRGNDSAAQLLLDARANPNSADSCGQKPLHWAAKEGCETVVQKLLAAGATLDALNNQEETPLHYATEYGRTNIVKMLINAGANVNAANKDKATPLHYAAAYGRTDIAKILINEGAIVDAKKTLREQTPLYLAVCSCHTEVVYVLLAAGADCAGSMIANCLLERGMCWEHKNLAHIFRLLLSANASPNAANSDGETMLHKAAGNGCGEIVKLLIDAGAGVNVVDRNGTTPLYYAARGGHRSHEEVVRLLILEADADVNITGLLGRSTPLHAVGYSRYPNPNIAQLLIDAGADPNAANSDGKTLLHLASEKEFSIVQLLIDYGADVDVKDLKGNTPLHKAASKRNWKIAELLILAGADVNAMDQHGATPLYAAVRMAGGNEEEEEEIEEFFQLLIAHDANAEARVQAPLMHYSDRLRNRIETLSEERLRAKQQWITQLKHKLPSDIVEHVILPLIHI